MSALSHDGARGTKLPPKTAAVAVCVGVPLLFKTDSTVGLFVDGEVLISELVVLSLSSLTAVMSSEIAAGISAKGGEGGFGYEVMRLALLPSPALSNVSRPAATVVSCNSMVISLPLADVSESWSAIAKQWSTSLLMLSAAAVTESISAATAKCHS